VTAVRPERRPIQGHFVRLEPFTRDHIHGLWRALGHPDVFAGGYGGGAQGLPPNEAIFADWAPKYFPHERGNSYVIRVSGGPHHGEVVGASSLADFDEAREHTHMGWTAFDPRVWGTQVNPEVKLLMFDLAFSHGYGRVKLQADEHNARSRDAILRLGATFEGIKRRDSQRADGTWRNTAVFSVLIEEWPRVRAQLETRLAAWGGRPVLFR
jgi:RimJ/RimL family protein N-acetyltransferase